MSSDDLKQTMVAAMLEALEQDRRRQKEIDTKDSSDALAFLFAFVGTGTPIIMIVTALLPYLWPHTLGWLDVFGMMRNAP